MSEQTLTDPRLSRVLNRAGQVIPWRQLSVQRMLKRLLDIVVSAPLMVFALPVMVLTGVWIRLTSKGPVLFAQTRLGLHGRPFTLYKFRTLRADLPDGSARGRGEVTGTDDRLTPLGGVLRAWRIDELPQLALVLMGHMSLVGPRPDLPAHLPRYREDQLLRFAMPPGCTGLVFVRGAFQNSWEKRQDINVEYVCGWSFLLDVKIILGSAAVLLSQQSVNPKAGGVT
jgi:lipopolysaccharide/colanic/teichoic acid biosynthesis glycosyltransferase